MSQIFISHSGKDEEIKNFITKGFAITNVRSIFMEFEKATGKDINKDTILKEIQSSAALFVILSKNVVENQHTRDWINFECGSAVGKDVWVFEPSDQTDKIDVVIPSTRNYVIFNNTDNFLNYFVKIIQSYDDTGQSSAALLGAGVGAALGHSLAEEDKQLGAILGGFGGLIAGVYLSDKKGVRPPGLGHTCKKCRSSYNLHIGKNTKKFRCPVCNLMSEI